MPMVKFPDFPPCGLPLAIHPHSGWQLGNAKNNYIQGWNVDEKKERVSRP
jgi:hypothetical protein